MSTDGEIDPDVDGALAPLSSEIEKLSPQCERVRQIFVQRGVQPERTPVAIEDCVELLADERLRAEFDVALGQLLDTFDIVLPRPAALPFVDDVVLFTEIQMQTRSRYRDTADGDFDPRKYKEKVRALIDQHITVLDLTQKIAPVRITDPNFLASVGELPTTRAKASEMEHALRHHIRQHLDEDPAYFGKLSERVDEILGRLKERWDQIVLELGSVIGEARQGRSDTSNTGLDPRTELPFHGVMAEHLATSDPEAAGRLIATTGMLVTEIRRQIAMVGFWENATKQDDLRRSVKRLLDDSNLFAYEDLDELSVNVVDLAKANHRRLT